MDIHHIRSTYLRTTRRITVMRPRFRGERAVAVPALYLNDGQNLFDPARAFGGRTWRVAETVNGLVQAGRIPPLLVVGIDHGEERRAREYLPVKDECNPEAVRPLGRAYVKFVTQEVVPFVERTYRVIRRPSSRGFGGSSYGAIAALLAAVEQPGVFGRLLLESPSLYVGDGYMLRQAQTVKRWPTRVYVGVGTAEVGRDHIDREAVANVRALQAILRRAGLGPQRLKVVIRQGATHSEDAWAARLADALVFLFGKARATRPQGTRGTGGTRRRDG